MKTFWKHVGGIFASIGKGAAVAALWASQHPEVLQAVGSISPQAGAIMGVVQVIDITVAQAKQAKAVVVATSAVPKAS